MRYYSPIEVENVFKLDRSLWQQYISPMITEIIDYHSIIPVSAEFSIPYSFLYKELVPEYKFKYNIGDILEKDNKYYLIYALPLLDARTQKEQFSPTRIRGLGNVYALCELNSDFTINNTDEILDYCDGPEYSFIKHSNIDTSIFNVH